jgi:hypothetical protein
MNSLRAEPAGLRTAGESINCRRRWDAQASWEALERVSDELGGLPRYRGYDRLATGREDLPSAAMLRQRLGRWSQIVAGLTERRGGDGVPEVVHAAA